jgi:hypothetical protein
MTPADQISQWNHWFPLVGMGKEWESVKAAEPNEERQLRWATIMELNRLNKATEQTDVDAETT